MDYTEGATFAVATHDDDYFGFHLVTCRRCGVVVNDDYTDLHDAWHNTMGGAS